MIKMEDSQHTIRVIGHKNPDTDSICSAIAYAYLKNQTDGDTYTYAPRRAGELNKETKFVLNYFHVQKPRLTTDVSPQIKNVDIRPEPGIDGEMSLRAAWQRIKERDIYTLCIVDEQEKLKGVITVTDIANANMNLFDTKVLSEAHTSYRNILETMDGQMLVGDPDGFVPEGELLIGTSPEVMEEHVHDGDTVMVTNRYEAQTCAMDCGAKCIIVCAGASVPSGVLKRAEMAGCSVILTHYDTYAASRLVTMAAPVRYFMLPKDKCITFTPNTPVDEASKIMGDLRHRYFPIIDGDGHYIGVISRRNLLNQHKKKMILVDHNEKSQAVDGLDKAEIVEIIDHHRLGNMETSGPVYFRNMPVGCTCTIVTMIYDECGVKIPRKIAGLLLSAILSDTLMFHSPTCTELDKKMAERLADIAGVKIEEYAEKMFDAGDNLDGESADDILHADYKEFIFGDYTFAVGQGFFMSEKSFSQAQQLVLPYLSEELAQTGFQMVFYLLTSIKKQGSVLLYAGKDAAAMDDLIMRAFHVKAQNGRAELPGVVSRKKQLIPPLRTALLV